MKILIALIFILAAAVLTSAQVECPSGYVCITAEAARIARDNALDVQKIPVLEQALKDKDKSIEELKSLNEKNVSDLKEVIKRTEIELATKTGQLIATEAERNRQIVIIEALLKMVRKKSIGIIAF
jgi:hypothetical protein